MSSPCPALSIEELTFSSQDETNRSDDRLNRPERIVKGRSSIPYTWDFPAAKTKNVLLKAGRGSIRQVDILEIGSAKPFVFKVSATISIQSLNC